MPQFSSEYPVTVTRNRGTQDETSFGARMGGDLAQKALFYLETRVRTGDEVDCDAFDEPRVIARVDPVRAQNGITHFQAELVTRSEWAARNRTAGPTVNLYGQGSRLNLNSHDSSSQAFNNSQPVQLVEMLQALQTLRAEIPQLVPSGEGQQDANATIAQLEAELRRAKPQKAMAWALLERLNTVGGLVEKVSKLYPILDRFQDWA